MIVRLGLLSLVMLQLGNLSDAPAKPKQYVIYSAEQANVAAGKKSMVELRFKVVDGFHVNSHTPKSELLIPTRLTFQPADGVVAGSVEYPKGVDYSFSSDPAEKLDVYTGAFTLKVPIEAMAGEHTVGGVLRYQACDHGACYPPKSLAISVLVAAK